MSHMKPCRNPRCTRLVVKAQLGRLNQTFYCSGSCASRHRVELEQGQHPLKRRTPEQRHVNAVKAATARAAAARKRKYQQIGGMVDALMPRELIRRFELGPEEIARIKALLVRSYLQGHAAGYSAGHTKQRRSPDRFYQVAAVRASETKGRERITE